jgi:LTXXQ motif family protein
MKKHILVAATAALMVMRGLSSTILADPREAPDVAGTHHPRFSAEDFAAFTDTRIAALKSGLQLKPTQEKKWFALETALREQAKTHAARAAESRDKAEEPHEHHDVIDGLRERAEQLEARSVELQTIAVEFKNLADAAEPLYESLDDAQKRRFEPLLRKHVGLPDRHLMAP